MFAMLGLAGCYAPKPGDCAFRCGSDEACPSGLGCDGDGFCRTSDATDRCSGVDASLIDVVLPDSALPCMTDTFDGTELATYWNPTAVGPAPTFTVTGGALTITDAAVANTPSDTTKSWIFDPDVDKGNQMAWQHPIGTGDFSITFSYEFTSSAAAADLAAVGVTDVARVLDAYGGGMDPSSVTVGRAFAHIRVPGGGGDDDYNWQVQEAQTFTRIMRIQRTAGMITVVVDGTTVLTAPSSTSIQYVAIIALRHRSLSTVYAFGTLRLFQLDVCY